MADEYHMSTYAQKLNSDPLLISSATPNVEREQVSHGTLRTGLTLIR